MYNGKFWKCRCMGNGNPHDGGVELMSGTWKVHNSLIHQIYPYGLNRELYEVIDVECDLLSDDNLRLVKTRNSNRLMRL